MRSLRLLVVLALSVLSTACGSGHSNVPPQGTLPPGQPGAHPPAWPGLLNSRDAQGHIIYRTNTGCFIEIPPPPPDPTDRPMAADDSHRYTQDVPCPAVMANDPAWLGCSGSEIYLDAVTPAPVCKCMPKSLPPPPPEQVACPALPGP